MNNPGEYPQPNTRRTSVRAPLVSDGSATTTIRLRATNLQRSGATLPENISTFTFSNPGSAAVSFEVVESSAVNSASGRTMLTSMITLAARGEKTVSLQPTQPILEVRNKGANGLLEMSIDSRLKYEALAFTRLDTMAPATVWEDNRRGAWSTLGT